MDKMILEIQTLLSTLPESKNEEYKPKLEIIRQKVEAIKISSEHPDFYQYNQIYFTLNKYFLELAQKEKNDENIFYSLRNMIILGEKFYFLSTNELARLYSELSYFYFEKGHPIDALYCIEKSVSHEFEFPVTKKRLGPILKFALEQKPSAVDQIHILLFQALIGDHPEEIKQLKQQILALKDKKEIQSLNEKIHYFFKLFSSIYSLVPAKRAIEFYDINFTLAIHLIDLKLYPEASTLLWRGFTSLPTNHKRMVQIINIYKKIAPNLLKNHPYLITSDFKAILTSLRKKKVDVSHRFIFLYYLGLANFENKHYKTAYKKFNAAIQVLLFKNNRTSWDIEQAEKISKIMEKIPIDKRPNSKRFLLDQLYLYYILNDLNNLTKAYKQLLSLGHEEANIFKVYAMLQLRKTTIDRQFIAEIVPLVKKSLETSKSIKIFSIAIHLISAIESQAKNDSENSLKSELYELKAIAYYQKALSTHRIQDYKNAIKNSRLASFTHTSAYLLQIRIDASYQVAVADETMQDIWQQIHLDGKQLLALDPAPSPYYFYVLMMASRVVKDQESKLNYAIKLISHFASISFRNDEFKMPVTTEGIGPDQNAYLIDAYETSIDEYLNRFEYDLAMKYCDQALLKFIPNNNLIYLKLKCLYELKKYESFIDFYQQHAAKICISLHFCYLKKYFEACLQKIKFKEAYQALLIAKKEEDENGSSLLILAVKLEDENLIKAELEKGGNAAKIDKTGSSALSIAYEQKNFNIIDLLLKHGSRKILDTPVEYKCDNTQKIKESINEYLSPYIEIITQYSDLQKTESYLKKILFEHDETIEAMDASYKELCISLNDNFAGVYLKKLLNLDSRTFFILPRDIFIHANDYDIAGDSLEKSADIIQLFNDTICKTISLSPTEKNHLNILICLTVRALLLDVLEEVQDKIHEKQQESQDKIALLKMITTLKQEKEAMALEIAKLKSTLTEKKRDTDEKSKSRPHFFQVNLPSIKGALPPKQRDEGRSTPIRTNKF